VTANIVLCSVVDNLLVCRICAVHCCESLRSTSRDTGKIDYEKVFRAISYIKRVLLQGPNTGGHLLSMFSEGCKLGMFSVCFIGTKRIIHLLPRQYHCVKGALE